VYEATTDFGQLAFGGSGDAGGVDGADASAVIQACIDALTAGGRIHIKRATYTMPSALSIQNTGITLEGEAWGAPASLSGYNTTLDWSVADVAGIQIEPSFHSLVLKNLRLEGSGADAGKVGLKLNGNAGQLVDMVKVEDTGIYNWDTCIDANYPDSMQLVRARLANCMIAFDQTGGGDTVASHSFFDLANTYGVSLTSTGANSFWGNEIAGDGVNGTGVYLNSCVRSSFVGNLIYSWNHGAYLNTSHGNMFQANYMRAFTGYGFRNISGNGNLLFCNHISPSVGADDCYYQSAGTGNSIIGNNLTRGNYAVNMASSAYDIVIGNSFDSNGQTPPIRIASGVCTTESNYGFINEKTGFGTGTGAQQTIPHGCGFTPQKKEVVLSEMDTGGALAYQSAAPNATNIYVIATLNKTYVWTVKRRVDSLL